MPIYELNGKTPRISPEAFIHPDAVVIGDVAIGARCFIGPGAVLRGDFGPIGLAEGVSFQDNAVIHVTPGSEVAIERDVIIGHSALLHDVRIAPRVVIGMGAVLLFNGVCEEDAFVAAGAVVPRGMKVPAAMIAAGNPASILKKASNQQIRYAAEGVRLYQELARQYKDTMKRIG